MRSKKLTQSKIKKALMAGTFNPKDHPNLSVIAEIGDSDYCIKRAYELLKGCHNTEDPTKFDMNTATALALIAMARVMEHGSG